jgi:hypothetical protein
MVGGRWCLRGGGRSGVGDEGVDGWRVGRAFERARSAARLREKKERRGGGGPAWGCYMARGRCPNRVLAGRDPDAARAGDALLFGPRCAGADRWAPMAVREGRERRGARGPAREENGVAEAR